MSITHPRFVPIHAIVCFQLMWISINLFQEIHCPSEMSCAAEEIQCVTYPCPLAKPVCRLSKFIGPSSLLRNCTNSSCMDDLSSWAFLFCLPWNSHSHTKDRYINVALNVWRPIKCLGWYVSRGALSHAESQQLDVMAISVCCPVSSPVWVRIQRGRIQGSIQK
jgi:hypothetical protein